jgi:hypothetical protein
MNPINQIVHNNHSIIRISDFANWQRDKSQNVLFTFLWRLPLVGLGGMISMKAETR